MATCNYNLSSPWMALRHKFTTRSDSCLCDENDLLVLMASNGIISRSDYMELTIESIPKAKREARLLDILCAKPPQLFPRFIKVLERAGQYKLACELKGNSEDQRERNQEMEPSQTHEARAEENIVKEQTGMTSLLFSAVNEDDTERLSVLLAKGASVDAKTSMNVTLLMSACRRQSKKLVNFLLSRGAKVNVTDEFGRTALMYAAMKGHEEIFTLLMEHNADVKKQDCFGQAVIHYAAIYNHKPILLMGPCCRPIGANVDIEDIDGCTALWWSAYHGYVDCADALFVHGADPVKKNKSNESPLGIAKKNGHTAVVSMITRALNSPSLKHVISVTMAMYEEPIRRQDDKMHKLDEEIYEIMKKKEELQDKLRQPKQCKKGGLHEGGSLSLPHPKQVIDAVASVARDQWYDIGLALGFSEELVYVTHCAIGVRCGALTIQDLFDKKVNEVGITEATEALLEACRKIPFPVIDSVMGIVAKGISS